MMIRTTTAALLAATVLASAPLAGAAGVDLLTDLSVSGSVNAFGNSTEEIVERRLVDGESVDETVTNTANDRDDESAASFLDFPLSATAESITPRYEAVGGGDAGLSSSREANAVSAEANLNGEGGFFQFNDSTTGDGVTIFGNGEGTASFRYEFAVAEAVAYTLTFEEEETGFLQSSTTSADFEFIDLGTGTAVDFDTIEVDPGRFRTTNTGSLAAGTYRLGFDAQARSFELGGLRAGFDFSVAAIEPDGPTPIPSPAALPAGVALLGGLLARRRR